MGELAENPLSGSAEHLPYPAIPHLRDCLEILKTEEGKQIKTVQRVYNGSLLYRTIKTGFYIGVQRRYIVLFLTNDGIAGKDQLFVLQGDIGRL